MEHRLPRHPGLTLGLPPRKGQFIFNGLHRCKLDVAGFKICGFSCGKLSHKQKVGKPSYKQYPFGDGIINPNISGDIEDHS